MNIDNIPLLMAFFWQGFSLSFVVLIWIRRVSPQFEKGNVKNIDKQLSPLPYSTRFALGIIGITGALGAASLLGTFGHQVSGAIIAFLVGLICSVLIAYLYNRTS